MSCRVYVSSARGACGLSLFLAGCPAPLDTGTDAGCTRCALEDDHVPPLITTLDADLLPATAGADIELDWSALAVDLVGRPMDPDRDVEEVRLYVLHDLTVEEVLEGVATDGLDQRAVGILAAMRPVEPRCHLSDLELVGHWIVPETDFVEGSGLWLLELIGADGSGLRSLALLEPVEGGDTTIGLTDQSAHLDVTLGTAPRTLRAAAGPALVLDWSALRGDALGNSPLNGVDGLVLSSFAQPLEELSERVLELDALAVERWSMDVAGVDEAGLVALEGDAPFPGLDADHQWLLDLRCGRCTLPLPRVLAPLDGPE